jgi:hypothetical protein
MVKLQLISAPEKSERDNPIWWLDNPLVICWDEAAPTKQESRRIAMICFITAQEVINVHFTNISTT